MSYSDESGSSDFPNISFDSNISVEQIGSKSNVVHLPVDIPKSKRTKKKPKDTSQCGSLKSEFATELCANVEQLNISYNSNDSVELIDFQTEKNTQNQGIYNFIYNFSTGNNVMSKSRYFFFS